MTSITKNISTLCDDIHNLFNGQIDHINIGVHRDVDVEDNNKPLLRMSNIGRPLRQLFYELTSTPKEELSGKVKFKFQYGHILEDLILSLAEQAGHTVTDRQKEIEVDGVPGHIDAIIDGVLVDVKSCSPYSFEKFRSGLLFESDPFGYVYQLSSYWACFPEVKRAGFLAIDKVSGDLYFLELKNEQRKSKDAVRTRIEEIREAVSGNNVPQRCYESIPEGKAGNLRLSVGCSYCGYKFHCWDDANDGAGIKAYLYSTGPKFLVKVVKEPKVQEFKKDAFPIKEEL